MTNAHQKRVAETEKFRQQFIAVVDLIDSQSYENSGYSPAEDLSQKAKAVIGKMLKEQFRNLLAAHDLGIDDAKDVDFETTIQVAE